MTGKLNDLSQPKINNKSIIWTLEQTWLDNSWVCCKINRYSWHFDTARFVRHSAGRKTDPSQLFLWTYQRSLSFHYFFIDCVTDIRCETKRSCVFRLCESWPHGWHRLEGRIVYTHLSLSTLAWFYSGAVNLPLKDFPQRRVLDPLEAGDGARGHGALKQHLNTAVVLCRFGERHQLKEESEMRLWCTESNKH